MKPDAISSLSPSGRQELADYEFYLREQRDISPVTVRNYLSDLRSFIVWYETKSINSTTAMVEFDLAKITTGASHSGRKIEEAGKQGQEKSN